MKAFLMYRDRDFDPEQPLPWNAEDLITDLELATLFEAMAQDDEFLFEIAKQALLSGLTDSDEIRYRQAVLQDCLDNVSAVTGIYRVAVAALQGEKKHFRFGTRGRRYPSSILRRSIEVLQLFVEQLKALRDIAVQNSEHFRSEGFTRLFSMLLEELDDDYFDQIDQHLQELKFRDGVLISAELGAGNKGANYVLHKPQKEDRGWFNRLLSAGPPSHGFKLHPRDESGFRALSKLEDQGITLVADALEQSTDHILGFFKMLRTELAFYMGGLNLHDRLERKNKPVCFPAPAPASERRHTFNGLYDVCLTLSMDGEVITNTLDARGKDLVLITGANQGGKSTFLRSVGLSQLMMQCGLFVPAESFEAALCTSLITHYKREEDSEMESGKFDEELRRMSDIVDHIEADATLLCNESLASTNEREGSEIARQIVTALLEKRTKVFFVTHFHELAHAFHSREMANALFLRAERQPDGERTFRLVEGEPLRTGHGQDLYDRIFTPTADAPRFRS